MLWKTDLEEGEQYIKFSFELEAPISPSTLRSIPLPHLAGKKGVILSGKGPIWLYGWLIHQYAHTVPWVAVWDPKVGGSVVVVSHSPFYPVGDVLRQSIIISGEKDEPTAV